MNLKGTINPNNNTVIEDINQMEVESPKYIDFRLYKRFWALQKYYHDFTQLFNSSSEPSFGFESEIDDDEEEEEEGEEKQKEPKKKEIKLESRKIKFICSVVT